jgi:hypothetical protein
LQVKIGGDFDHLRPLTATYRPVLVWLPGDLLAAA